jgi:hypothetical protein
VPARLIGENVGLRTDDGRLLVIVAGTGEVAAGHLLVAPGEASVRDEHYGGPRPRPAAGGAGLDRGGEGVLHARAGR